MAGKAIESVLAQTFEKYELIIVDDGSEDGLNKVVKPYLSEKVFYHRISHRGVSAARNHGLKRSRGDYIAYLDSDNLWHPDYLLKMWEALHQEDPPRMAAYCMYNLYKRDEKTGRIFLDGVKGEEFNFKKLIAGNYIDINSFVHSRDCIDRVGLWDETLKRLVDWDYIIRVTAKFGPLFLSEVLVDYFLGATKESVSFKEDYTAPYEAIRKKNRRYERPVTLEHDTIRYQWTDVPHKKYYNWMRMTQGDLDTTTFKANGFPFMLQIEPTNFCNLSCPLCPAGSGDLGRDRRHMTLDEFKSIIDDLEDYLLLLVMWSWGEPFLSPDLPAMIKYASEKGIKTVTSTNGQLLSNESYMEELMACGLTTLIVAIDSLCEENYKAYRRKGSLNLALDGLKRVVVLKKKLGLKTHINMRMVIMRQNEHEIDSLRSMADSLGVDRFSVKTVNPSCDSPMSDEGVVPENPTYRRYEYVKDTYQRIRVNSVCGSVWGMCEVHSNGDIVPCCYDYDGKMKIGNINQQKITEVWNGPGFRALRRRVTYERDSLKRCKDCGINFKLSSGSWFVESLDFSRHRNGEGDALKDLEERLQNANQKIESLERQIEEMQSSIVWQLLMRYHEDFVEQAFPCNTKRRRWYDHGLQKGRLLVKGRERVS
jgi:radical SAM protein with 4Fe4S-binding SPASM domain